MDELVVSRLYRRYLSEIRIGFYEVLIISLLFDGTPRSICELDSQLDLGEHVLNTHIGVLKDAGLVVFSQSSELSVQLTESALRLGSELLLVQANVDLDFGVASESIARIRNALVALARRARQSGHE